MDYTVLNTYVAVSFVIVMAMAWAIYRLIPIDKPARILAASGFFSIVCVVSYFVRVTTDVIGVFAWMTTVHLICVDFTLLLFLMFVVHYTQYHTTKSFIAFARISGVFVLVDVVCLLINPFKRIVLDFGMRSPEPLYSKVIYAAQYPLYYFHMGLAYVLIFAILTVLVKRMLSVPAEFARQYKFTIVGLFVVFLFNVASVFILGNKSFLNFSVGVYALMGYVTYLFAYKFENYIMLNYFKESVFENVSQGIVLFDFEGDMLMRNTKAVRMLPTVLFDDHLSKKEFEQACNIVVDEERNLDVVPLQCTMNLKTGPVMLRCDYRKMRNSSGTLLGYLYVFADLGMEADLLTGYHKWESFKNFTLENASTFALPMTVILADINNLSVVNSVGGKERGDQMLREFARILREEFPKDAYYVRATGATLALFCYNMPRDVVAEKMEAVRKKFGAGFLYALERATEDKPNILNAVETAYKALYQKKLVDRDSKHSDLLNSLLKSLRERDPHADAHMEQLKKWSAGLGPRLNLTDKQQSDLELLCMLHNIGKIAVPTEILNKPSALTADEWRLVQGHVEKGAQIAKSAKDFAGVADLILHQHERWDGKGYPDGLSRESIPLLCRIVSVLNAYDAMLSERPYRKALTKSVAIKELRACAGTQFDPAVVAEFLQVLNESGENIAVAATAGEDPDRARLHVPSVDAMASMKAMVQELDEHVPHVHTIRYSRYILDSKNKIISVDDNFEVMTGYTREDIREKKLSQDDLIPPEDLTEYLCLTSEVLANNQIAYFEHRIRCKNGSMIYVFCMGRVYYDSATREFCSEIIIHDSSNTFAMRVMKHDESEKSQRQLRQWEDTYRKDSLTGVLNRSAFQSDVEEKLLDEETKVMLLMIDVDNFKGYNDTYGHRAGDEYLIQVARAIQGALRGSDLACRMGGDEFAAALFFKRSCETSFMHVRAGQIYERIMNVLQKEEHFTGLSMGVVVAEKEGTTFKDLYEASDKALYNSKESGRGRMSVG